MYHIHRTKAFVLKNLPIREADSRLILFTEKYGMIQAIVQSGRKIESKMRQSIQELSLVEVALVSGKAGWRVINVNFLNNFYHDIRNQKLCGVVCKVFSLLERLVLGEIEGGELFDFTSKSVEFIAQNQESLKDDRYVKAIEIIFLSGVLENLGYMERAFADKKVSTKKISIEQIEQLSADDKLSKKLVREINRSIRDSQL